MKLSLELKTCGKSFSLYSNATLEESVENYAISHYQERKSKTKKHGTHQPAEHIDGVNHGGDVCSAGTERESMAIFSQH